MNLVLLLTGLALAAPVVPPTPVPAADSFDPRRSLAPLVAAVEPAVVTIEVLADVDLEEVPEALLEMFGEPRPEGEGSGFIVDPSGIMLTNHHVVAQSKSLRVVLHDDTTVGAKVLGSDADLDIAVLQLEGDRDWPSVQLADSEAVRVGDWVVALGNALGLGTTATTGIVSGMGRRLNHDRFGQDDFIQTDAAINQGNSGGPLFDLNGRVIGMNTAMMAGANTVGFAISSNLIALVLDDLKDRGHVSRGYLGVHFAALRSEVRAELGVKAERGVLVTEVESGTPAAKSGLDSGDVIVEIDGRPIDGGEELFAAIGGKRPGERVELDVERNGKRKRMQVTLAERPATTQATPDQAEPPPRPAAGQVEGLLGELGLLLADLPPEAAEEAGVRKGVLIDAVRPGSAAFGRLFPGDIIVEVNRRSIDSVDKCVRMLERSEDRAYLQVVRGDAQHFVELPLP